MDNRATQYLKLLMNRFPNANVFWEKVPDTFFDSHPCTLVVSPRSNPDKKYILDFPKGLGAPSVDADIEIFITQFANELDK